MNLKDYKAGRFVKQFQYESFSPSKVNHTWVWEDPRINTLLEDATRALGELNAFSKILPDVDMFIQMHVVKEANTSSRIEGTQTSMDEVLMDEEDVLPEKRDDWHEVQNYVEAMNTAIEELKKIPLSNRLLKKTHSILMQSVRGEHKTPGEFRTSQNWIGGSNLTDAIFIPPHQDEVQELMSDLEKFYHNEEINVPHLIRIAISHYQFETIHPFLDGNGRIGRLLITLYLVSHGLLLKPSLYLSDFFEKNKTSYYDALMHVRTTNDIGHWIKFFLNALISTAQKGVNTFNEILKLKNEVNEKVITLGIRAENASKLLNFLYKNPFVEIREIAQEVGISIPSATKLVKDFEGLNILEEITGQRRDRIYMFKRYYLLFLE
ncbi:MAG: Fic family protein [Melioribacteraceae bacterium]|nr:Fic family protein [Melioribacteraceae bacterium]MCF8355036.1 Fic family protein [Melioribacteraceae bacterium]MCF8392715.1 Fic family protein [Melioribacteraceae bacterium]MCF8417737.1 Fic family protein [Melioribacteraceae bacterium]